MFAGCSKLRQRLGDIVAGTIVVEEAFAPGTKLVALLLWLAALTSAGWGLPRVYSAVSSHEPPPYFANTVVQLGYTADSAYLYIPGLRIDLRRDSAAAPNGVATVDHTLR
jgi:hypothetical protein